MLFDLRAIKYSSNIDDSQYIHQLTYNELRDAPFRELLEAEYAQLRLIKAALVSVIAQRAVTKRKMLAALGKESYWEYVQSYDMDISHVENDWTTTESMPSVLCDYMQYVKDGDKYTRLANLFRRSTKRAPVSRRLPKLRHQPKKGKAICRFNQVPGACNPNKSKSCKNLLSAW